MRNSHMPISKDITIEELVEQIPESVSYLRQKGIVCIICGEPVWGTLYELASQKGFTDEEILAMVEEIGRLKVKG